MDLFSLAGEKNKQRLAPLADRMRPETLDDIVGQEHILGKGKLLRRAIEADKVSSLIFYGPPGTGKTTLAKVIARCTSSRFEELNAVTSGIGDIRRVTQEAKQAIGMYQQKTILFIDEIHRFNRSQQDALLPYVEDGTVTLIGATTENPYFQVNSALLSRSMVFSLNLLSREDLAKLGERALKDEIKGLGNYDSSITKEAMDHLIETARGDARRVLNALELAVLTTPPDEKGIRHISLAVAEESIQKPMVNYDKKGDQHYDVISAFIKSMRGSDPDATLHWLARMIYAGEDPNFIARRLIIHAAEDVGLAEPQALVVAMAAAQAVERIGMPEGRIPLAQAALYIATAPKSNSVVVGIDEALADMGKKDVGRVPAHLRDAHYPGAKKLGNGTGYKYPHDYPDNFCQQQYMPDSLLGRKYYHPSQQGKEVSIGLLIEERKKLD